MGLLIFMLLDHAQTAQVAKEYGATEIINYKGDIVEQVLETKGAGVDKVLIAGVA